MTTEYRVYIKSSTLDKLFPKPDVPPINMVHPAITNPEIDSSEQQIQLEIEAPKDEPDPEVYEPENIELFS